MTVPPSTGTADAVADAFLRSAVGGPSVAGRGRARFHPLTVVEVRPLTADAIEVTFAVPDQLQGDYGYLPGQYVALRTTLDGQETRRSYSLCRPPTPGSLSIAIKRDRGGRFSTWAQTELHPGDTLEVMSPQGTFTSALADLDGAHIAGIAAGSGITPVMALASAVLARSDTSRVTLVYTNRSSADVMFLEDLADLKDRYPTRLALHHVLSREQRSAPLLSGRIDAGKLRTILDALVLPETIDEWFLCGPLELVQLCRDTLADIGVDRSHVRYELFTSGDDPRPHPVAPLAVRPDAPSVTVEITLDGHSATVQSPVDAHESILTAALRVRPDAPFACAGGVCGTCRARLLTGSVHMTENYALEPDELERGYILTCQSHPTSDRVAVDYDV
ncbi:phenylacetate-CoA oxygenase/reductase subunit PaaK [Microbacterium saccharophilum]|uniref:Phenylacetate-CoA oxygenase/reductase subunit PaaK n=1 Tax=Microbacterium saccharophilum TaxID=1213358 RepID=A0A5C8HV66_9MICO|nr:1,2-phenylacetyl-CoA epoxidase subunit PaaE [Microbacterium saccharophilum]TXK08856.1 phenylacetate-CoA oxygenase/reductase subunit PaaK [Microbacterium saccharophilum]GEP48134.1 phenylacetic acid degradation protein [Microbacterium saccharophilum]